VCHDRFDDAARRLRSNVEKCIAYGFAASAEEIDSIVATRRFDGLQPAFQNYLSEIVRCRTESWAPAANPSPDQLAIRTGGTLEFGSPEAESWFRTFACRRRIPEVDIQPL